MNYFSIILFIIIGILATQTISRMISEKILLGILILMYYSFESNYYNLIIFAIISILTLNLIADIIIHKILFHPTYIKYTNAMNHTFILLQNRQLSALYKIRNPKKWILYFHGNMQYNQLFNENIFPDDASIFTIDYSGYGESTGNPSIVTVADDAIAAYEYMIKTFNCKPEDITIVGLSLGGAVAARLAYDLCCYGIKVKQLIVISTFSSIKTMAIALVPILKYISFLLFEHWPVEKYLQFVNEHIPVVIMHGQQDEVIPYSEAERNAKLLKKQIITLNGGHNNSNYIDYLKLI